MYDHSLPASGSGEASQRRSSGPERRVSGARSTLLKLRPTTRAEGRRRSDAIGLAARSGIGGGRGWWGDDAALEMLRWLSGSWVQGCGANGCLGGLHCELHDDVYSNVVNGGLCGVISGSAYGTASEIVDGRNILVFINCIEVSFCLLRMLFLSLFISSDGA